MKRLLTVLLIGLLACITCSPQPPIKTPPPTNRWGNVIQENISSIVEVRTFIRFLGEEEVYPQHGTGFAISNNLILTCAHVLYPSNELLAVASVFNLQFDPKFEVKLSDGEIINIDPNNVVVHMRQDLALIEIEPNEHLTPIGFETEFPSELGQELITMGYPGLWGLLIDNGIISKEASGSNKCEEPGDFIFTTIPA